MNTSEVKPSTARIAEVNPRAISHYKDMRALLMSPPGVDNLTCEIAIVVQLALLGHEVPFKVHAMRALALKMPKEQLQGIILTGIGITMIVCEAARALAWLDEAHAEFVASQPPSALP